MAKDKFVLQLDPTDKIVFAGTDLEKTPVTVTLKLKNPEKERFAYKVKCTSNSIFRIRPPVGTVDAGATAEVQLTFSTKDAVPESGKHYFAVYYIKATKADEKPRDTWAGHKGAAEGEKRLCVDFKKDGAATKPAIEAKKEEAKKDAKKEEVKKETKKEEKKETKKEEKKEEKKETKKEEKKEVKKDEKKEVKKEEKVEEKKEEKEEEKEEDKEEGGDDKKEDADEGGDEKEGDGGDE